VTKATGEAGRSRMHNESDGPRETSRPARCGATFPASARQNGILAGWPRQVNTGRFGPGNQAVRIKHVKGGSRISIRKAVYSFRHGVCAVTTCDWIMPGTLVTELPSQAKKRSQDAALVESSLAGDERAFERLVKKYRPLALRTAFAFLQDRDLARDIAQEAFVRVHRQLKSFDMSRTFSTWLRRITVNLCIDELRRRRRRTEVPLDETLHEQDGAQPGAAAVAAERKEAVWKILEELPENYRTVMILREIEGLPTREVAKILKRPKASVRWRLHRARKLFRDMWTDRYKEESL